jgi:hypothetical protein
MRHRVKTLKKHVTYQNAATALVLPIVVVPIPEIVSAALLHEPMAAPLPTLLPIHKTTAAARGTLPTLGSTKYLFLTMSENNVWAYLKCSIYMCRPVPLIGGHVKNGPLGVVEMVSLCVLIGQSDRSAG